VTEREKDFAKRLFAHNDVAGTETGETTSGSLFGFEQRATG
jgi:hypothetical protein